MKKNIEAVAEVLRSGWLTTGPKTKLFEKEITSYIGCSSTICLASATAGLELMLRWFGLKEGDEVIVPTLHLFFYRKCRASLRCKDCFRRSRTRF